VYPTPTTNTNYNFFVKQTTMINAVFYYWNKKTKESEKTTTFKINNNNYVKCEKNGTLFPN
jgi:hypothetical protein